MHDYRPTSPNASLNSFNTRHSRFSENTAYELPTTDRNVLFAQSSDYELQSPDKEALLLAPVRPEPSGNNSDSDSERLLAQARDFADSEANLYTAHNGSAFKDVTKPPKIKRSRGFYITRLALRVLSTLFSVAIVAALADVLVRFKNTIDVKQHYQNGSGTFKVWPNGLKIWPTLWLLGTAVAGSVLGIVVLLASFNKKVRRMTKTGNITTIIVSGICLVLWTSVTAYYASWDTKETNWDLLSWACSHSGSQYTYENINFGQTCAEGRLALWVAAGLAALELVNLLLFVVWFIRQKNSR